MTPTDPIRTALERAARELELSAIALRQGDFETFAKRAQNEAHAARAALAKHQGEGAALLESREPASVPDHLPARPEGDWFSVALVAQDMRSRGLAEQACGEELLKLANSNLSQPARPCTPPAEGEVGELPGDREATAIEALKRLRQWGRLSGGGYSADVVLGVVDWIDGGMEGPLPPLPAHALLTHKKS